MCRYGPRESDRKEAYSDKGRLTCDVKYTAFATRQRSRNSGQVIPAMWLSVTSGDFSA